MAVNQSSFLRCFMAMPTPDSFFSSDTSRIVEIVSATPVTPTYVRLKMRSDNGANSIFWVSAAILGANLQASSGSTLAAVVKSIQNCLEAQEFFRQLERDFILLDGFLAVVPLGIVKDLFKKRAPDESAEVVYSVGLNDKRLCIHSLFSDGWTRLFVARAEDDAGFEWRLEYCPPNAEGIKEAGRGTISDDDLDIDRRPAMFRWALACFTGPRLPPPL
jgi:hypothetical protein